MGIFGRAGSALSSLFGGARPTANTKPNGGDGVQAYGGFLPTVEANPELIGTRKWITYGNAANTAIVSTGLRYALGLLAGTSWHVEPNESGGADAQRAADIVDQGLIKAQMDKPWSARVRKVALYKYFGFSLHEWSIKTRSDGMIVFSDLGHRPQHTIDRWDKPSEQEPWHAVSQLTQGGNRWTIPRGRLLYAVDDTLTDNPDGIGLMRHVVELVRRLGVLEGLETLAYETDIRGMPIGRAPLTELRAEADAPGADKAKIDAFVSDRLRNLHNAVTNLIKSPERLQHLILDSKTYVGSDPNNITSTQKWGLELLRGDGSGVAEVAAAIGRIQLEIARVLGIEFAMVGGLDSAGSYGMHADKTGMFATNLQTTLTEIAAFATNDLARVLVGLNGLDPETCTPTLVAEPISTDSIMTVCQALSTLAQAALRPDDPAIPVIRKRLRLPPPPEPTPEEMGALGSGPSPSGPPDPSQGEEDVPMDDMGLPSDGLGPDPVGKAFEESKHPRAHGKFSHAPGSLAGADHKTLARAAQEAADIAPLLHGFGDGKVFQHHVYNALRPDLGGMSLADFKQKLADAHGAGHIRLARADLVSAMDSDMVAASEHHQGGGGFGPTYGPTYHFINRTKPRTEEDDAQAAAQDAASSVHASEQADALARAKLRISIAQETGKDPFHPSVIREAKRRFEASRKSAKTRKAT